MRDGMLPCLAGVAACMNFRKNVIKSVDKIYSRWYPIIANQDKEEQQMKYHGYIIMKTYDTATYGNRIVYEIRKNRKLIAVSLTSSNAKEFIDSGKDYSVLLPPR